MLTCIYHTSREFIMNEKNLQEDIDDLQSRLAFQEDMIEQLNLTVAQQAGEIDLLKQQLKVIYRQLQEQEEKLQQSGGLQQFEVPPHY